MKIKIIFQGNYDAFVRTRQELEENQMKRYNKEQDEINHMKVGCFFRAGTSSPIRCGVTERAFVVVVESICSLILVKTLICY